MRSILLIVPKIFGNFFIIITVFIVLNKSTSAQRPPIKCDDISSQSKADCADNIIQFDIGHLHLEIPRAYLFSRSISVGGARDQIELRANMRDLSPIVDAKDVCFGDYQICPMLDILIINGELSSEKFFAEALPRNNSADVLEQKQGYEVFVEGPPGNQSEFFRKQLSEHSVSFHCYPPHPNRDTPGICTRFRTIFGKVSLMYRFGYGDIFSEINRDAQVCKLLLKFVRDTSFNCDGG